jgi:glycosyltransferase involved in cell wall biosynthesis
MNIAFLDTVGWDYDVSTPYQRPLGGSQSALAYLAAELARRGVRVTLYGGAYWPREVLGVRCVPAFGVPPEEYGQAFDALIVLNGPAEFCLGLRPHLAPGTPLVLWTQHAADQPAMRALQQSGVRQGWDAIVCVSQWHRAAMIGHYGLDPARVVVHRNAIAPCFEGLFSSRDELVQAKGTRPILGYTSTPFRGLDLLTSIFSEAHKEFPDAQLAVFSSMKVYQQDEPGDAFAPLYTWCRQAPGVVYVGSVSQPELARALKATSILAYPNTFAETSCIAVMEALAAGLLVITTDLGALPETTLGFGTLVAPLDATRPDGPRDLAVRFLDQLRGILRAHAADPAGFAAARLEQVEAVNASCTWRGRASQWEDAIRGWKDARTDAGGPR